MAEIKDKSTLTLKETLTGAEEIVVSSTEKVTTQQIAELSKGYVDGKIGDIDTILDSIITTQETI